MDSGYARWAARWRIRLGFGLGIAYLIFAQPTPDLLAVGGTLGLAGLALRGVAAGHLEKGVGLATSGPYAHTRNPLYFGSFTMASGLALAGGSWVLGLVLVSFFLAVYYPVMRSEEHSLRQRFGERYDRYAAVVPLFFPRPWPRLASTDKFCWARYRKNREYEAGLGFMSGIVFLVLKLHLR